jgi:GntR family transcriptional repressor for pyruvate dehydrogenase complex
LAERFGVSRGVARECIRGLEERGLVSVRRGRGAIVSARERWDVFNGEVLVALLAGPLASEVLSEYLECRRLLEVEAAGLAASRRSKQHVARLTAALGELESSTRHPRVKGAEERFHRADVAFHQAIFDATGNLVLGSLARRIHDALLAARYPLARPRYRAQRALPEHQAIYDAIVAGDAGAARAAMVAHLETVEGYLHEHARRVAAAA